MISGLDHIGVAVTDLETAIPLWESLTGGRLVHRETVLSQHVEVAVIRVGSLRVELLRPTDDQSPIAKFIATRGPGIHHVALESSATQAELDRLQESGAQLIDHLARPGAEGTRVGFVHPRAVGGVLLEIVEHPLKRTTEKHGGSGE